MFTGTINIVAKNFSKIKEIKLSVSNYKNFGTIMSFNFPLSGYVGTRSNYYNFKIDGYQYVKNIKVGVHFYQLDDNLFIYLNGKHIISQDRAWCIGSEYDCVINSTFYYTIPASNLNLTNNNLSFRVDHYNSGRDGICTGAWFSFEIYYE